MKPTFWLWAAGLMISALPGQTLAAPITYDCDTAADHFSELVLPAADVPFTVSGNLQLNALAGSKKYVALARI